MTITTEQRDKLDAIYRDIVNKREDIIYTLNTLDDQIFNFENILYDLHEEGWLPSDLFYEGGIFDR